MIVGGAAHLLDPPLQLQDVLVDPRSALTFGQRQAGFSINPQFFCLPGGAQEVREKSVYNIKVKCPKKVVQESMSTCADGVC